MFSLRNYFKLGDTGYKELAKRVYREFSEEDVPEHAAAMAYYFLFASFPFLLFLTTLIGYIPIPDLLNNVLDYGSRLLPGEAFRLIEDNIRALFMNKKEGLLSIGILLALWASSNAIVSVMDAMNNLYDVKEGRPFWKVRLIAIALVIGLSLLLLLAMTLLMFGHKIGDYLAGLLNLGPAFQVLWIVALIPVTLFLLALTLAVVYYFTPDVEHEWRWISPGAVMAIPVWVLMSLGFSFYINSFGSYDKTYGSIGAVIVLLLWLYLSGLVVLTGAVINAVIEHSSEEGKAPGEKVAGQVSEPREEPPERQEQREKKRR